LTAFLATKHLWEEFGHLPHFLDSSSAEAKGKHICVFYKRHEDISGVPMALPEKATVHGVFFSPRDCNIFKICICGCMSWHFWTLSPWCPEDLPSKAATSFFLLRSVNCIWCKLPVAMWPLMDTWILCPPLYPFINTRSWRIIFLVGAGISAMLLEPQA
jgi:hypothetical protein